VAMRVATNTRTNALDQHGVDSWGFRSSASVEAGGGVMVISLLGRADRRGLTSLEIDYLW
jgi:hypothetical protein